MSLFIRQDGAWFDGYVGSATSAASMLKEAAEAIIAETVKIEITLLKCLIL